MEAQSIQDEIQVMDVSELPFTKKVLAMNGGVCGVNPDSDDDELMNLKGMAASHN
ncbi:MAG: hypothetical protein V1901_03355 [Patescibacteria group bacterium]